jgi:hypothetical protein
MMGWPHSRHSSVIYWIEPVHYPGIPLDRQSLNIFVSFIESHVPLEADTMRRIPHPHCRP